MTSFEANFDIQNTHSKFREFLYNRYSKEIKDQPEIIKRLKNEVTNTDTVKDTATGQMV